MLSTYAYSYSTTNENWRVCLLHNFSTFFMPVLRGLTACQEDRSMLHYFSGMSALPQNLRGKNVLCGF